MGYIVTTFLDKYVMFLCPHNPYQGAPYQNSVSECHNIPIQYCIMWLLLQRIPRIQGRLWNFKNNWQRNIELWWTYYCMAFYRMVVTCLYRNGKSQGHKFKPHLESSKQYTIIPLLCHTYICWKFFVNFESVPLRNLKFYDGHPQPLKIIRQPL